MEGIDYDESFELMAHYLSFRTTLAPAAQMGWKIHQTDVKIALLNDVGEEEIYIEQPKGFETHSEETHVCRLKRALYGLKQAPQGWYSCINNYFID